VLAACLVELDQLVSARRETAMCEPLVEGLFVVADPLDVEHGHPLHFAA
jgi:hypothetical protein